MVDSLPCVVECTAPARSGSAAGQRPEAGTARPPGEPPVPAATGAPYHTGTEDKTDWLDAREDEAWRRLLSVHAKLLARLDDELRRGHELSLADYEVLVALSESEGALRMTELAERVMLSPSGLTRRVDRLVGRGLVDRRACPSDGRGSLAAVTAAGWDKLRHAAPTHVAGVRRYLLDPVSSAGIEQLAAGLRAVDEALEAGEPRNTDPGPAARGRAPRSGKDGARSAQP